MFDIFISKAHLKTTELCFRSWFNSWCGLNNNLRALLQKNLIFNRNLLRCTAALPLQWIKWASAALSIIWTQPLVFFSFSLSFLLFNLWFCNATSRSSERGICNLGKCDINLRHTGFSAVLQWVKWVSAMQCHNQVKAFVVFSLLRHL